MPAGRCRLALLLAGLLVLPAAAQTSAGEPHEAAVVEAGGAFSRGLESGGTSAAGPDFGVEWTPIEHWLELEAGTSLTFARGSREWIATSCSRSPGR